MKMAPGKVVTLPNFQFICGFHHTRIWSLYRNVFSEADFISAATPDIALSQDSSHSTKMRGLAPEQLHTELKSLVQQLMNLSHHVSVTKVLHTF
jgi:hypothetical protein